MLATVTHHKGYHQILMPVKKLNLKTCNNNPNTNYLTRPRILTQKLVGLICNVNLNHSGSARTTAGQTYNTILKFTKSITTVPHCSTS